MPIKTGNSAIRTQLLGLVELYHKVVFGASGAVAGQTPEVASGIVVTEAATGMLTLTFKEAWKDCVFIDGLIYNQGTATGQFVELEEKWDASGKTVKINIVSDAGADEDVASGNELWLRVAMINTGSPLSIATA